MTWGSGKPLNELSVITKRDTFSEYWRCFCFTNSLLSGLLYFIMKKNEKEEDMNYMDVAKNEHFLIIVLRKMLIIQMSEDEVEAALSIGINTLT